MNKIIKPISGEKILMDNNKLIIPDNPIIPFIEGDGIGQDIWRTSVRVFDSAVKNSYNNQRKISQNHQEYFPFFKSKSLLGNKS